MYVTQIGTYYVLLIHVNIKKLAKKTQKTKNRKTLRECGKAHCYLE